MSKNLIDMRTKEDITKAKIKQDDQAALVNTASVADQEKHGKYQLAQHKKTLKHMKGAISKAFKSDAKSGVAGVKVNKLKTQEKLVKIKNGSIVKEMQHDEKSLAKAKMIHKSKSATKKQKLDAMKGEVRSLMFLKALNNKATGALSQVAELKKDLKKSENVVSAQALISKIAKKNAAKTKSASASATPIVPKGSPGKPHSSIELIQESGDPLMEALIDAHDNEDELQDLANTKEATIKRQNNDACACNGAKNMHHHGSSCRDWERDGSQPWCYVSWACRSATPSSHMAGAKWASCKEMLSDGSPNKLMSMVATQAKTNFKPSKQELGEPALTTPCSCSGTENRKKHGGHCANFDYTQPWCYVSVACDMGYVSQEVAGAKWVTGCEHPERVPNTVAAKMSTYDEEKLQLGEGLQAAIGQGRTHRGWSWGVTIMSQAKYPACIEECKRNPSCVGASYTVGEVASNDPAASSMMPGACNQFAGITQKNGNTQWNTWLSPRHP